jgi:hypothetical protein
VALTLTPWLAAVALVLPASSFAAQDFSAAEKAIFMADQLSNVRPPSTLRYSFHKAGSLEAGYDDTVAVTLSKQADGSCCASKGEFLSGERKVPLPEIDNAKANPVILYFLEHDIREMHRLTKGSENYFRKRIRMTVYQGATVVPPMMAAVSRSNGGIRTSSRGVGGGRVWWCPLAWVEYRSRRLVCFGP